jgi:hypothetical protein
LVLEEEMDADGGFGIGGKGSGEEEVAVRVSEVFVEKGSRDELELVPLDEGGDFCGEMLAEKSCGVGRVREAFFEELVVWLLEVLVAHGGGEEYRLARCGDK